MQLKPITIFLCIRIMIFIVRLVIIHADQNVRVLGSNIGARFTDDNAISAGRGAMNKSRNFSELSRSYFHGWNGFRWARRAPFQQGYISSLSGVVRSPLFQSPCPYLSTVSFLPEYSRYFVVLFAADTANENRGG